MLNEYMPESIIIVGRSMGDIELGWKCPYEKRGQIYCQRSSCKDCGILREKADEKVEENKEERNNW